MDREKKQEYALLTAWGASFIATLGSLYFSEIMKFEPCVLCWYQRIFMYPFVLWLGIAIAKKDYRIASYSLPIASIGACISLYHYGIQKISALSEVGAVCGRVPCTGEYINWFGFITIPFLALIGFMTIIICSFIIIKNK
ncbi:disulfide oxidoreductase [Bacillus cytotoxicus]|uniref:disulfide formation protein C n=1 Tax=Bacillus cytotoxicus TaxID=580165 RepID=UPI000863F4A9|nr:disulfide oxidoreductase [Bacillus cytotoxicus]AWC27634.1 disulfide bond formation protein B [Bacillus cytotoxicus]AWC40991.1 disulfide bond formation protein B [Bacillus cytotoxicus]AWC48922.1 disulfide bond formation protein B [Bacillus cytotoxicus]AWC51700.1 disulfide bond formation protein B [Bacillus cytotoxicus]AWC55828.1 disulfide bond formation protein B [Bacillus cytotoxicus]